MASQQSNGSKLGAIGGALITLGFFTPWLRACGQDINGYDLATSKDLIEAPETLWLVLLVGIFNLGLFFLFKTNNAPRRFFAAILRFVSGIVGTLPILYQWLEWGSELKIDIQVGGFLTGFGFLGIWTSFLVDAVSSNKTLPKDIPRPRDSKGSSYRTKAPPHQIPHDSLSTQKPVSFKTTNQSVARFCNNCGTALPEGAEFCVNCGKPNP